MPGRAAARSTDGRIELSTSVNPGNPAKSVTTDGTHLIGIISAGANVKHGVEGFAIIDACR
ncbi:MAG: hypothetical protein H6705_02590 [Myxococcales bacterium]|nr:hypothetical protein [Myxococcales bacterium]